VKTQITVHDSGTRAAEDVGLLDLDLRDRRLGYASCRYHIVVRRDGSIEKSRDPVSPSVADSLADCHDSISVCLVGGKASEGKGVEGNFTAAQLSALEGLAEYCGCLPITSKSRAYDQQLAHVHSDSSPVPALRIE
jgi:N-acetylmuramoyl-L-alanine amidase